MTATLNQSHFMARRPVNGLNHLGLVENVWLYDLSYKLVNYWLNNL